MIDYIDLFDERLIYEEICESPIALRTNMASVLIGKENSVKSASKILFEPSIEEFYSQINLIQIHWDISPKAIENVDHFKNDPWIKENYLDEGYEWSVVHEMLSGFINIQKFEDILNPEFCEEQGYYYKLKWTDGINADDYLPFDICAGMTACLKVENGKILDNIWLVITEDVDECLYDMNITIEEYLNLAYQAKLFRHWQAIFLWKSEYDRFELMKRFLPKIVPHVELDLSSFGMT